MCNLLQSTPLLHCTTRVIQLIAFVFCSHPVCFVERLMLQLCVLCVLHTDVTIVAADMSFILRIFVALLFRSPSTRRRHGHFLCFLCVSMHN